MPNPYLNQRDREIVHITSDGAKTSTRKRRPFDVGDEVLGASVLRQFLEPALRWLVGPPDGETPSLLTGSHWEAALTLTCARTYLLLPDHLTRALPTDELKTRILTLESWLFERATKHEDGTYCWDHSVWDTAVVLRAVSGCRVTPRLSYSRQDESPQLQHPTIRGSLKWLCLRWREYLSGPASDQLNSAEIAQIGWTLAQCKRIAPMLADEASRSTGWAGTSELLQSITDVLMRRRSPRPLTSITTGDSGPECWWWDDWFGTADVVSYFLNLLYLGEAHPDDLSDIDVTTVQGELSRLFLAIEDAQFDGLWGGYLDSIVLVGVYAAAGAAAPATDQTRSQVLHRELLAQPRTTFRSLRWMCDNSQIMQDGSFLHTGFLTTFYVQTLLQLIENWQGMELKVSELYDELSLLTERGTTIDRAEALQITLDRDALRRTNNKLRLRYKDLRKARALERLTSSRVLFSILTIVLSVVVLLGFTVYYYHIHFVSKSKGGTSLPIVIGVVVAAAVAVITLLWTISWGIEDFDREQDQSDD